MKRKKKIRLTTTFALLREKGACESGYRKLREHLGKKYPDDKPINLLTILKSNGVQDMLWCLRATVEPYADYRLHLCGMYADIAASVLPIYERKYDDDRPRKAIDAARSGDCSDVANAAAYAAIYAASAATYAGSAASAAIYAAYAASAAAYAASAASAAIYAASAATYAASAAGHQKEQQKQAKIIRRYLT